MNPLGPRQRRRDTDLRASVIKVPVFSAVLANTGWLSGSRLAADAMSFLFFVVLSREFGASGIGTYAYAVAIAALTALTVGWGLKDYGIRDFAVVSAAKKPVRLGRLLVAQAAIGLVVAALLAAILVGTGASPRTLALIFELSIYQVALVVADTLFVPAYDEESMAVPAVAALAARIAAVIVGIWLILGFAASLPLALVGFPAAGGLLVVGATFDARRRLGALQLDLAWSNVSSVLKAAWPFGASDLMTLLYLRADVIMLSVMLGSTAVGLYASSLKFIEVAIFPLVFLGVAAYPRLCQLAARNIEYVSQFGARLLGVSVFAAALISWVVFFLLPAMLGPVLGEEFVAAGPILRALAPIPLLVGVESVAIHLMLATGLQVERLKLQVWTTGLNVAVNAVLIPLIGVMGAVIASVGSFVVMDLLVFRSLGTVMQTRGLLLVLRSFIVPLAGSALGGLLLVSLNSATWLVALGFVSIFGGLVATSRILLRPGWVSVGDLE